MYFELNGNMSKFEGCLKIEIHSTKPLLEKVCQYQLQCQTKYKKKQTKYKAEGKNSRNQQETKNQRRLNKTKG